MAEESPFELDSVKLRSLYKAGADLAEDRRGELDSWFDDYGSTTAFDKHGFTVTKLGSPPKQIKWVHLALHWKSGRDAVFTFLGVEVPVDTKAMAWAMLIDLLRPGTSPPCPLCCLFAPVSPLSFCLNSPNQRVWW